MLYLVKMFFKIQNLRSVNFTFWPVHVLFLDIQEEEKDATNGEGSASPRSALSGSMLSHGHDLSHLRKDRCRVSRTVAKLTYDLVKTGDD